MKSSPEKCVIQFNQVSVQYPTFTALDRISFSINQGEFIAILGPNGSGKSTLIKTTLGLIEPTTGTVQIFGKSPADLDFDDRRRLGYVPQLAQIDRRFPLSVFDMVLMGRYSHLGMFKKPRPVDKKAARTALSDMGLHDLSKRSIGQISGGQRQRALIARALVGNPDVLILDEPTSGLDVQGVESLYSHLKELKEKRQLTVILVSHDVGVVTNFVDSIACLAGKLVAHGRPAETLTEETLECMYGKESVVFGHHHVPHVMVSGHKEKRKKK